MENLSDNRDTSYIQIYKKTVLDAGTVLMEGFPWPLLDYGTMLMQHNSP